MYGQIKELEEKIQIESEKLAAIEQEISKAVIGQEYMIKRLIILVNFLILIMEIGLAHQVKSIMQLILIRINLID